MIDARINPICPKQWRAAKEKASLAEHHSHMKTSSKPKVISYPAPSKNLPRRRQGKLSTMPPIVRKMMPMKQIVKYNNKVTLRIRRIIPSAYRIT